MKFTESEEIRFLADAAARAKAYVALYGTHGYKDRLRGILGNLEHRLIHDYDDNGEQKCMHRRMGSRIDNLRRNVHVCIDCGFSYIGEK